jgi:hypothetical protein
MYDLVAREKVLELARVLESQGKMPREQYMRLSGYASLATSAEIDGDPLLAEYYARRMELLTAKFSRGS